MKELETSEAITDKRLKGNERFHLDGEKYASVKDFWAWANSDISNNTIRGVIAEFLVAQALDIDILKSFRKEWEPYDLLYGEIKIEVKSAAFVQSWHRNCCSKSPIRFDIRPKKVEEPEHFEDKRRCKRPWSKEAKRRCHVYVFCLFAEKERGRIFPLDISQWKFYVVNTQELDEFDMELVEEGKEPRKNIYLSGLEKIAKPVPYNELPCAVSKKGIYNVAR